MCLPVFADGAILRAAEKTSVFRFDIAGDHAFIVPEYHDPVTLAYHMERMHRHLAAPAREINHELGDSKSGGVPAEEFDDLDACTDRGPEMRDTAGKITLVQAVRPYPAFDQPLAQFFDDIWAVLQSAHQHALVTQDKTGICQLGQRLP